VAIFNFKLIKIATISTSMPYPEISFWFQRYNYFQKTAKLLTKKPFHVKI